MKYKDFITEIKPLLEEARSLFNADQLHENPQFRKWRHKLTTKINTIDEQGYWVNCGVESRSFDIMTYSSVSKKERLDVYNRDLQDTINELETVIDDFNKYGDPKTPKKESAKVIKKDDSPHVEVARIGARQAIIVALITAVAAILGTVLSQPIWQQSPSTPHQWYISIKAVELLEKGRANEPSPPVRIIPIVNNQAYSYPSRTLWIRTESTSSGEDFPLPVFSGRVAVRFDAIIRRGEAFGNLTSQEVQSYTMQQLPVKGTYDLRAVTESQVRGEDGTTKVRVYYEINKK